MNRTSIQWTQGGYTWNPIKMRCTPASAGCANCWHLRMAKRHAENHTFSDDRRAAYAGKSPVLDEKELNAPMRIKKPVKIAVQLMGDLFHEAVEDEWLARIFCVMHKAHQHTFQILTKRPQRMLDWMTWYWNKGNNTVAIDNLWLGVSVEDQATADERIPLLLNTPAAVRWISAEPLLGPLSLGGLNGWLKPRKDWIGKNELDWVVVGGESGPGARPFNIAWAQSIRGQCLATGVPFFMKQMGRVPNWTNGGPMFLRDRSGGDMAEWTQELRVRQFP